MKSRILYFILIVIIIVSVLTGILIWRKRHIPIYPKFENASLSTPLSSKFIPRNADLVFHWKINPNNIPAFVESYYSKSKQKNIRQKVDSIMETSFNLIGIDFKEQAYQFAGEYGSFALINDKKKKDSDWIIILHKKQNINSNDDLRSIINPEEREEEKNIAEYKSEGVKNSADIVMSRNSNSTKPVYFSSKDKYILISSSSDLLELSLNDSEKNSLESPEDSSLNELKSKINDGFALLEISTENIFQFLNLKNIISGKNQSHKLISSIDLNTNELILNGIVRTNEAREISDPKLKNQFLFIGNEINSSDDFILINSPNRFFNGKFIEPYNSFIIRILNMSIDQESLPLLKLIGENSDGPLIWLKNKNNWAIVSRKDETNKNSINEIMSGEQFRKTNLNFNNKNLEAWSKLITNNLETSPYIEKDIMALIQEYKGTYLWSKSLSSISENNEKEYFINNLIIDDESEENKKGFIDIIKLHLGEKQTNNFLQDFYPYTLLRATIGSAIGSPKGIDISIAIPNIENPDLLKFEISFKLS